MKRFLLMILALALLLAACTSPAPAATVTEPDEGSTINAAGLGRADNYADLMELYLKSREKSSYDRRYFMMADDMNMQAATGSEASKADYSLTNIQVDGVDEADIIKTDGSYLYVIANNRLYIVDVREPANLQVVSTLIFEMDLQNGEDSHGESPAQMYLDIENQRLVLIVSGWLSQQDPYEYKSYTSTLVYDIADRSAPRLTRSFTQSGDYLDSRRIAGDIYVISCEYRYSYGLRATSSENEDLSPADVFPSTCSQSGEISMDDFVILPARQIAILPDGDVNNQMIIAGIDTLDDSQEPSLLAVLGTSGTVFCSADHLYVASYHYPYLGFLDDVVRSDSTAGTTASEKAEEPRTDIYRFSLADGLVSEDGRGSVPGWTINSYSMDEYMGFFRIATTLDGSGAESGPSASTNNLFILDNELKIIGRVEGLAEGETIKSVRFLGDQAYIVTFRNVDPLFVVDLSSPAAPVVLGQLKIPGYSTYLHPYGADKLLGFGYDVAAEGDRAWNGGLKVSLFDISDFSNPREESTIVLGGRGSYSELLYSPKALLFSLEKNLIAFPAALYEQTGNIDESGNPNFQGLLVLMVGADGQLSLRGSVSHLENLADPYGAGVALNEEQWNAFWCYDAISRCAYVGNTLFTISCSQIRATALDSLQPLGQISLPGYESYVRDYFGVSID